MPNSDKHQAIAAAFGNFPCHSLWRLFIDYNRQDVGPQGFDVKEPGYLKSLCNGFDYMLQTLSQPLSTELLVNFHDIAVGNTFERFSSGIHHEDVRFEYGFRKGNTQFGLTDRGLTANYTRQGIAELLQIIAADETDRYFSIRQDLTKGADKIVPKLPITDNFLDEVMTKLKTDTYDFKLGANRNGVIEKKVSAAIERYHTEVTLANNDDTKIRAIARCIHQLEIIHPFPDGNCRTMMLVMNKLLVQQGLNPAILENPNRIDAYSVDEICEEIKRGQQNFANCALAPLPDQYHDDALIYLEQKPALARLYALQIATSCSHWAQVVPQEQERALMTITSVLSNLALDGDDKGLSWKQLQQVSNIIKAHMEVAIYQKSWYQPATLFYRKSDTYGIHFASTLNQYLVPEALDVSKLNMELHDSLKPQPPSVALVK